MTRPDRSDLYMRRIGVAVMLTVAALVLATLLTPKGEPGKEWYEHTGIEGPTLILNAIEIQPDDDDVSVRERLEMPNATEGIAPPITEDIVTENPLEPLPKPDEQGTEGDPDLLERVTPEITDRIVEGNIAEAHRASQQSNQFVLLFAVPPHYPEDAHAQERSRRIVVRVNIYVNEAGGVEYAYIDRNDGGPRFEEAVLVAVRQWVYRPLVIDGKASDFWDRIYFVFHTESGSVTLEAGPGGR